MGNHNYAPNPLREKIYVNLQNKKLSEVTALDIQKLTDPTFIQATNQDALITYNIVNKAAMRDGQVMPNTGGIRSYVQSDANVAVNIIPPTGEVWKIMGISIDNDPNVTGTNAYYTYLSDPTQTAVSTTPSGSREVFYSSFTSASNLLGTETMFEEVFQPLIITSEMYLRIYSNMAAVGVSATTTYNVGYMRLR